MSIDTKQVTARRFEKLYVVADVRFDVLRFLHRCDAHACSTVDTALRVHAGRDDFTFSNLGVRANGPTDAVELEHVSYFTFNAGFILGAPAGDSQVPGASQSSLGWVTATMLVSVARQDHTVAVSFVEVGAKGLQEFFASSFARKLLAQLFVDQPGEVFAFGCGDPSSSEEDMLFVDLATGSHHSLSEDEEARLTEARGDGSWDNDWLYRRFGLAERRPPSLDPD